MTNKRPQQNLLKYYYGKLEFFLFGTKGKRQRAFLPSCSKNALTRLVVATEINELLNQPSTARYQYVS